MDEENDGGFRRGKLGKTSISIELKPAHPTFLYQQESRQRTDARLKKHDGQNSQIYRAESIDKRLRPFTNCLAATIDYVASAYSIAVTILASVFQRVALAAIAHKSKSRLLSSQEFLEPGIALSGRRL